MFEDYFLLALRNLKKRGLRSWLTMLGIFIGIAAVVSLISLGQGLEQAVIGQFASLDPDKLIIQNVGTGFGPPGSTAIKKLTSDDVEIIEKIRGTKEVIPRYLRIVKVEYNEISDFKYITSITEDNDELEILKDSLNVKVSSGNFLEIDDHGKVVLGSNLIDKSYEKDAEVGSSLIINDVEFRVKGILEPADSFTINSVIFMTEKDLEKILDIEDEFDLLVVQIDNPDDIEIIAREIEEELRKDRDEDIGEESFSVETPVQSVAAINSILDIINLVVIGIAAISLLIGGIGIANTMFTSVLERTKEIGIMKAIGAKNKHILTIFMIESALLGLVGGFVGVLIGLGLAFGVSLLVESALGGISLDVSLSIPLITASVAFSLTLGLLFGIVPAYQASKLNPVEALRK